MSLQDKLDEYRAGFLTRAPAATIEAFKKATADLIATGQAERALKAGDKAPSFTLPDSEGAMVSTADLLANGPLVLTFYRGVWCPYCNLDLKALQEAAADIEAAGALLVAVSPQTASNSRKAKRDHALSFPVLNDHLGKVADAFGLRFAMPTELIEIYKGFGNDLTKVNDDPEWRLPMPARYVIGQDGVIVYAEVNPDYTRRPDPSELMPTLKSLKHAAAA